MYALEFHSSCLVERLRSTYVNSVCPHVCLSGVTTVLTMTFLGLEARTDLPQVPYPTALDYFVFISFIFIFSTVVQVRYKSTHVRPGEPKGKCQMVDLSKLFGTCVRISQKL